MDYATCNFWKNWYPVERIVCFINRYPPDLLTIYLMGSIIFSVNNWTLHGSEVLFLLHKMVTHLYIENYTLRKIIINP